MVIYVSDLGLTPISLNLSLRHSLSEKELLNYDFKPQYLSIWSSDSDKIWLIYQPWAVNYDPDVGTAVNSCHQLSTAVFTSWSPKIDVRGLLCKSLFCKMFLKFPGHEFWETYFFCSSKTDRATDFFFFNCPNNWAKFLLTPKSYVSLWRYSGVIWHLS